VDRLLDLIRSIEPSIVTWDASGRDRDTTVTEIGLVHRKACLRIGVFRSAGQVSVMFTSEELPDPARLLMDGAPFLRVTPENVSDPEVAQLIREAVALCRAAAPEQPSGGLRSAIGRFFGN
jgi:hypothetical protein